MKKRFPAGTAYWRGLLIAAMLSGPALFGATVNPIAINVFGGGPYISTDYSNGTFVADNEVQLFSFDIASTTDIYIQTISWASLGGFTPQLTLFKSDGSPTGMGGNASPGTYPDNCAGLGVVNSLCLDAFIQATVDPGSYLLALTQAGNDSMGSLSDGFFFDAVNSPCPDAAPNYTSQACLGYGGQGAFSAAYGDNPQLNGVWALSVGTPEPVPGILMFSGMAALAGIGKMRAAYARKQQERIDAQKNNAWRAEC